MKTARPARESRANQTGATRTSEATGATGATEATGATGEVGTKEATGTINEIGPTLSVSVVWAYGSCLPSMARSAGVLEEARIDIESLIDARTRIPMVVANRLLERAIEEEGDPALGLRIGIGCPPGAYGMVEQLARAAPTLRDSIACYERYGPLIQEAAEIELIEQGPIALIGYRSHEPQPRAVTDFALSYCLTTMRRHVEGGIQGEELRLAMPAPCYREAYGELLGVPARFDASLDAVVIRREDLTRPMREARPPVYAVLEAKVRQAYERLIQSGAFAPRVRGCLRTQLATGRTSLEETARRLHVSTATLRRRLTDEGTSHREILDFLRAEVARHEVLAPHFSPNEVARRLGFSHPNGFYKAFKRWTGLSPREYRIRNERR